VIRFLQLIIAVFVTCAAFALIAHEIGQTVEVKPTYLDTGGCDQPCWQGLRPGISRIDEFLQRVDERSPYSGRGTDMGGPLLIMELSTYGVLTLADVVHEFGAPEQVSCLSWESIGATQAGTVVKFYYAGGLVEVDAVRADTKGRVSPDMLVRSIRYAAPGEPLYEIGTTSGWRGFAWFSPYPLCFRR
jgi:hypothetical protein